MQRNLPRLANNKYDVLVLGGGIYGVWCAWDAALRGLSVALVDKGDFGHATSSNNLKIVHGGLRYLQHGDLRRMRESIRERRILMQIAPHLVHPLPFVMPTYRDAFPGKGIMALVLAMNDLIGFDRNRSDDPHKHLPGGRVISKSECLRLLPGIDARGLTGGAVWYDCQMSNSDRLLLSALRSATKAGAEAANYVEAVGFLTERNRVTGIRAKDVLTGQNFDIKATVVVNTSGPWASRVLGLVQGRRHEHKLSKAMNVVTKHRILTGYAAGVSSRFGFKDRDAVINKGSRLLFITPWHNNSIIGTTHVPYEGGPENFRVTDRDIRDFVIQINEAYPAINLKREDVSFFHGGLLPASGAVNGTGSVSLLKQHRILDHMKEDGIEGLVSVIGVKFTTARAVAQRAMDLACRKLDRGATPKSLTEITPVHGGDIDFLDQFVARETGKRPAGMNPEVVGGLIRNHGSAYTELLAYLARDPVCGEPVGHATPVIKAEVLHGIREEMAQKLADVVMRRTQLGSVGFPGETPLRACAAIMSREMGWSEARTIQELDEVRTIFTPAD